MQLKFIHLAAGLVAGLGCMLSCVEINEELGKEYIPTRHLYDVYTDTIYLKDIRMKRTDKLSGYSTSRITIGSVRDEVFGLTTRGSAFTLIPVDPDMDFGKDPVCTQFHFSAVRDTLSWPDESQANIIQNVNVYRLSQELGEDVLYIDGNGDNGDIESKIDRTERVAPVFSYFGQDSLSFNFNTDFGDEYIKGIQQLQAEDKMDSVSNYVKVLPGIYIETDEQVSDGGRINMFDLAIQVTDSYYIGGNYAELKFKATYDDRGPVDTSFLFFFGAQAMSVYQQATSSYSTPSQTPQYAFNIAKAGEIKDASGDGLPATQEMYIEGGSGIKPVISAKEIKDSLDDIFGRQGINPDGVIVHKATVVLPYKFNVEEYESMYLYPDRLSPTCRRATTDEETGETIYSFAGLTDSSVESENKGDINRSMNWYAPDISHHVQEILRRVDDENSEDYDIWMLTMANEVVQSESSDNSSLSDYYANLAYYDYYNSLYNYGYGGYYGGYYGNYYDSYYGMSNYYNYMLAAQYASSQSTSQTTVSMQLDKDRYYRATLNGPEATADAADGPGEEFLRPRLTITYSVSKMADR